MAFKKNTPVTGYTFGLINKTDNSDVTTGTTTGYVTLDGGTQTLLTNPAVHEGNGQWGVNLTAAELNGDIVGLLFTNSLAITRQDTISTYVTLDANLVSVVGSTTSANNMELQYDGTGLVGANYPATQDQVSSLAVGAGGISTTSVGLVITTGTQVGTYLDTFALDGVYNTLNPSGGVVDAYYEFNVGTSGVGTEILWEGYVQGNNDEVQVFGWDWVGTTWIQVGSLLGSNGVSLQSTSFVITSGMTGADADAGKVRLRLESSNANNINTDRILCTYTALIDSAFILHAGISQGATDHTITLDATASNIDEYYTHTRIITTSGTGAEQERVITAYNGTTKVAIVKDSWSTIPDTTTVFNVTPAQVHASTTAGGYDSAAVYVDGANGEAGTLIGVNGTSTNPSLTMADARAVADLVNIKKFSFSGGSLLSLDQAYQNFVFDVVQGQLLNLNGQDVSGAVFMRSGITGTGTSSGRCIFELCGLVEATVGVCNLLNSGLDGTITLANTDRYLFWSCFENGSTTPTIDINGDGVTPTKLELLDYSGSVVIKNMTSVDKLVITGAALVTLDSTNVGGSICYSGDVKITDNSTNSPTFITGLIKDTYDSEVLTGAKVDAIGSITSDTNAKVTLQPTTVEFEARTLPSATYFDFTTDQVMVSTNNDKTGYSISGTKTTLDDLSDTTVSEIFTTVMTESYSVDGAEPTLAQAMYLTMQNLQDFSFSGITQTVHKLDGVSTASEYLLDDALTPTSKTRSS